MSARPFFDRFNGAEERTASKPWRPEKLPNRLGPCGFPGKRGFFRVPGIFRTRAWDVDSAPRRHDGGCAWQDGGCVTTARPHGTSVSPGACPCAGGGGEGDTPPHHEGDSVHIYPDLSLFFPFREKNMPENPLPPFPRRRACGRIHAIRLGPSPCAPPRTAVRSRQPRRQKKARRVLTTRRGPPQKQSSHPPCIARRIFWCRADGDATKSRVPFPYRSPPLCVKGVAAGRASGSVRTPCTDLLTAAPFFPCRRSRTSSACRAVPSATPWPPESSRRRSPRRPAANRVG